MNYLAIFPSFILFLKPDDEEQVHRNYRRMTCRATTARIVLTPPGTSKPFLQNRQAIAGLKEKVVVYSSYWQLLLPAILGVVILSLRPDSPTDIPFLIQNKNR